MEELLVSVARVDITPGRSLDLSGVPSRRSEGVLKGLEAQVLVLHEAAKASPVVLVALDTLYAPSDWGDPVRKRIGQLVGAPPESVTIAATHTHAAPGLATLRCWGTADAEYRNEVAAKLVEATRAALANQTPAVVWVGTCPVDGVSCNRRTQGGPVDPTVTVLRIEDIQQQPLAAVVHFGCHPVTLWGYRNQITPDFPGYLRDELKQALGGNLTPIFVNGPAGNVNPADFDRWNVNEDYSRGIASRIAGAALKAWEEAEPLDSPPLGGFHVTHRLTLDPATGVEELDAIIKREERFVQEHPQEVAKQDRPLRTIQWANELKRVHHRGGVPEEDSLELQALRLGDLIVLAVPGELYVEIGLRIKQMSPFRHTIVVGYANGMLGYLCTQAWQEQAGAQEKFINLRLCSLTADSEATIYRAASEIFELAQQQ